MAEAHTHTHTLTLSPCSFPRACFWVACHKLEINPRGPLLEIQVQVSWQREMSTAVSLSSVGPRPDNFTYRTNTLKY